MEENNIWNRPQGEIDRNWMSPMDVLALLYFKILKRTWLMRGFVWFCCSFQVWTWNFARGLFQSFHVIWNHNHGIRHHANGPSCYHEGKPNGPYASAEVRRPYGLGDVTKTYKNWCVSLGSMQHVKAAVWSSCRREHQSMFLFWNLVGSKDAFFSRKCCPLHSLYLPSDLYKILLC